MKTIFLTGASSGIGKATAIYFADKGWNVAATMRNPEKDSDLKETDTLKKFKLDVTDKKTISTAVNASIKQFGQLDVVVNNAGYGAFGIFEAASEETIQRQFDVNVFGVLAVTKAVLPHFRKRKSGVFINITSVGGKVTFPTRTLYHGTKFAIEGISEALNYELNPLGIKVKIVEPGLIRTDFAGRSMDSFTDDSLTEYKPMLDKIEKSYEGFEDRKMTPPEAVSKVIFKAATSKGNRMRFAVGNDAKMLFLINRWLGTNIMMKLIKQRLNL